MGGENSHIKAAIRSLELSQLQKVTDPSVIRDVEIYLSNLGPSGTVAYEKITNALNLNDVTQPIDANTENNEIAENAPIEQK